jgi:hypothetical protein
MGISPDEPKSAVTERQNTQGLKGSPSSSPPDGEQLDVVKVDEDPKQDPETKDETEQTASLGHYFVRLRCT